MNFILSFYSSLITVTTVLTIAVWLTDKDYTKKLFKEAVEKDHFDLYLWNVNHMNIFVRILTLIAGILIFPLLYVSIFTYRLIFKRRK